MPIKTDGIDAAETSLLTTVVVPRVVAGLRSLGTAPDALKQKWFGAAQVSRVAGQVATMRLFVDGLSGGKTITFRRLSAAGLYGSVWPTVATPYTKQSFTVGSGIMIRLQDVYFTSVVAEKVNTVFHELTHKLLDTDDALGYNPADLEAAAISNPAAAIKNAENWTQFFAECVGGAATTAAAAGGHPKAGASPRALFRSCGGKA
jgi:hypothetical protein